MNILNSTAPIDFNKSQNSPKNEFNTKVPERFLKQFQHLTKSKTEHRDCGSYPEYGHILQSARPANAALGMWVALRPKAPRDWIRLLVLLGYQKNELSFFNKTLKIGKS